VPLSNAFVHECLSLSAGTNLDRLQTVLIEKARHILEPGAGTDDRRPTRAEEGEVPRSFGAVLDTWTSQKEGTVFHTVIRCGEVRVKDWFTCGGYAGNKHPFHSVSVGPDRGCAAQASLDPSLETTGVNCPLPTRARPSGCESS
jgi:hypothetical protein